MNLLIQINKTSWRKPIYLYKNMLNLDFLQILSIQKRYASSFLKNFLHFLIIFQVNFELLNFLLPKDFFFSWTFAICALKWWFSLKQASHMLHLNGLFASWAVLCIQVKFLSKAKGQLISKANFHVLIWTKNPTKLFFDFCPCL